MAEFWNPTRTSTPGSRARAPGNPGGWRSRRPRVEVPGDLARPGQSWAVSLPAGPPLGPKVFPVRPGIGADGILRRLYVSVDDGPTRRCRGFCQARLWPDPASGPDRPWPRRGARRSEPRARRWCPAVTTGRTPSELPASADPDLDLVRGGAVSNDPEGVAVAGLQVTRVLGDVRAPFVVGLPHRGVDLHGRGPGAEQDLAGGQQHHPPLVDVAACVGRRRRRVEQLAVELEKLPVLGEAAGVRCGAGDAEDMAVGQHAARRVVGLQRLTRRVVGEAGARRPVPGRGGIAVLLVDGGMAVAADLEGRAVRPEQAGADLDREVALDQGDRRLACADPAAGRDQVLLGFGRARVLDG